MKKLFLLIALVAAVSLAAAEGGKYIVLSQSESESGIAKSKKIYEQFVAHSSTMQKLQKTKSFELQSENIDGIYILKAGPFQDSKVLTVAFMQLKKKFASAFILDTPSVKVIEKQVLVQREPSAEEQEDYLSLWIALFTLAAIGVLALFLSSEQIKNLKKSHTDMQDKQDEIKQIQNRIIADMSQNIYNIAQETANTTNALVLKKEGHDINKGMSQIVNYENKLLDVTSTLIEFLRIKSKKVEIKNENFKLSNLLNEVAGTLIEHFKNSKKELVYDIDEAIPNTLIGDTLYLSKVITNIVSYSMQNGANEVVVQLSKKQKFNTKSTLSFLISTDFKKEIEDENTLFNSSFNEERQKYEHLDLFVAKELAILMEGDLKAYNKDDSRVEFAFSIPYQAPKMGEIGQKAKLSKAASSKNVLIIGKNKRSNQAIEAILKGLKYTFKTLSPVEYTLNETEFKVYDLMMLDAELVDSAMVAKIKEVRQEHPLKVISISSLFKLDTGDVNGFVDLALKNPLTRESLFDVFEELFKVNLEAVKTEEDEGKESVVDKAPNESKEENIIVHRGDFADTPNVTLESFSMFRGAKILLVEDNLINQKVLISVLSKSGIEIAVANNGDEAVKFIRSGESFDLVLMDINMPVMDGYTATKIIREDSKYDALPIVSLTALTSVDEVNRMFSSGMNGFLAKPFYKEKLFTVFDIFIQKRSPNTVHTEGKVIDTNIVSEDRRVKKDRRVKSVPVENDRRNSTHDRRQESDRRSNATTAEYVRLDGLDTKRGIEHNNGNVVFYIEVLKEFKDAYGESDTVFEKLVTDFRFEQVKMLCIDMKGLAGSIGATGMYDLATEVLQKLVFKKFDILPSFIERYNQELERLNSSIDEYLGKMQ